MIAFTPVCCRIITITTVNCSHNHTLLHLPLELSVCNYSSVLVVHYVVWWFTFSLCLMVAHHTITGHYIITNNSTIMCMVIEPVTACSGSLRAGRNVVITSPQTLLRRKDQRPGTYTLSHSFSHTSYQSQSQILRLPSPYVPVIGVPLYIDHLKTYASRLVQCVMVMLLFLLSQYLSSGAELHCWKLHTYVHPFTHWSAQLLLSHLSNTRGTLH